MDNNKTAAIKCFKQYRKMFCDDYLKFCPKDSIAYQATLKEKEFFDMAIRALEQEVLYDKVRAEINRLTVYYTTKDKGIKLISQNAVNRIFDKYKEG